MEALALLGRTLGFSFAAGVNLYATVAIIGLAARYEWVALPPQFAVFDHDLVIGAALAMYLVEFVADKVPWFDSVWDAIHTVIRPLGGAAIAVAGLGEASPVAQGLIALLGGGVAATSHAGKAGTRAVANTSPEPFSNWILSLAEDGFVIALGLLAITYPVAAAVVVIAMLIAVLLTLRILVRALRRRGRISNSQASGLRAQPSGKDPSAP